MSRQFSRQELYDLVWSEPLKKLAPRFGISDVGLAKACRRIEVPVPERGYWAKVRAGKRADREPLPLRLPGMSDEIRIGPGPSLMDELTRPEDDPRRPVFPEDLPDLATRVRKTVGRVSRSKGLTNPHLLIEQLLKEDEQRRERQRTAPYASHLNNTLFDSPLERRRFRILNALLVGLERSGADASLRHPEARKLDVLVGHQHISFTLDSVPAASRRQSKPERLELVISYWNWSPITRRSWKDSDETRVDHHLTDIVVELIVTGEVQYRELAHRRYQVVLERKAKLEADARRAREEEQRRERERLALIEKARVDRLLADVAAWKRATALREYVAAVQEANSSVSDPTALQELDRWANWAIGEADRLDPLRPTRASASTDGPMEQRLNPEVPEERGGQNTPAPGTLTVERAGTK